MGFQIDAIGSLSDWPVSSELSVDWPRERHLASINLKTFSTNIWE